MALPTHARAAFVMAVFAAGLAACNNDPAATTATPPAETTAACDADAAAFAVGQAGTPDLVEQARVAAGAAVARTIAPGQVVTMEFRADRLTLDLDAAGSVTRVSCG